LRRISSKQEFKNTAKATDIDIRIKPIPLANKKGNPSDYIKLPIGCINFSLNSIMFLLQNQQKETIQSIDAILDESKESIEVYHDYINMLLGFVRLENTDQGIQYTIGGAFHDPIFTSLPWLGKVDCDCDGLNESDEEEDDDNHLHDEEN
jgi:hypothetical protein